MEVEATTRAQLLYEDHPAGGRRRRRQALSKQVVRERNSVRPAAVFGIPRYGQEGHEFTASASGSGTGRRLYARRSKGETKKQKKNICRYVKRTDTVGRGYKVFRFVRFPVHVSEIEPPPPPPARPCRRWKLNVFHPSVPTRNRHTVVNTTGPDRTVCATKSPPTYTDQTKWNRPRIKPRIR